MPSTIRKRSYGSVTIYSIDKTAIWQALHSWLDALRQRPEVLAVILFGSMASQRMGVGSDVDVLLVLSESDQPFLERTVTYKPRRFPVDIDVFPYTWQEIQAGQKLAQEALRTGQVLWVREGFQLDWGDME